MGQRKYYKDERGKYDKDYRPPENFNKIKPLGYQNIAPEDFRKSDDYLSAIKDQISRGEDSAPYCDPCWHPSDYRSNFAEYYWDSLTYAECERFNWQKLMHGLTPDSIPKPLILAIRKARDLDFNNHGQTNFEAAKEEEKKYQDGVRQRYNREQKRILEKESPSNFSLSKCIATLFSKSKDSTPRHLTQETSKTAKLK